MSESDSFEEIDVGDFRSVQDTTDRNQNEQQDPLPDSSGNRIQVDIPASLLERSADGARSEVSSLASSFVALMPGLAVQSDQESWTDVQDNRGEEEEQSRTVTSVQDLENFASKTEDDPSNATVADWQDVTSVASSVLTNFDLLDINGASVRRCKRCTFHNGATAAICRMCCLALIANPCEDSDRQIALSLKRKYAEEELAYVRSIAEGFKADSSETIFQRAENLRDDLHEFAQEIQRDKHHFTVRDGIKFPALTDLLFLSSPFISQVDESTDPVALAYVVGQRHGIERILKSGFNTAPRVTQNIEAAFKLDRLDGALGGAGARSGYTNCLGTIKEDDDTWSDSVGLIVAITNYSKAPERSLKMGSGNATVISLCDNTDLLPLVCFNAATRKKDIIRRLLNGYSRILNEFFHVSYKSYAAQPVSKTDTASNPIKRTKRDPKGSSVVGSTSSAVKVFNNRSRDDSSAVPPSSDRVSASELNALPTECVQVFWDKSDKRWNTKKTPGALAPHSKDTHRNGPAADLPMAVDASSGHASLHEEEASDPDVFETTGFWDKVEEALQGPLGSAQDIPRPTAFLSAVAEGIKGNNPVDQLECTAECRRLVSIVEDPPVRQVVEAGLVPHLVQFLSRDENPSLQFESVLVLTKISNSNSDATNLILQCGAIPEFVRLLASRDVDTDVREKAVLALGNIAGDSISTRDYVLDTDAMESLLFLLQSDVSPSLQRNAAWTLSNFYRGKPKPDLPIIHRSLPVLEQLVSSSDQNIVAKACWALVHLSDGPVNHSEAGVKVEAARRMLDLLLQHDLLRHPLIAVQTPALRIVRNIVKDFPRLTVDNSAIPSFEPLLSSPSAGIRNEVCWIISNIAALDKTQIKAIVDNGIIPRLLELLADDESVVRKEAARATVNVLAFGSAPQINFLAEEGCISPLCDLLLVEDVRLVSLVLDGLERILKLGDEDSQPTCARNQMAVLVKNAGGFGNIRKLKERHSDSDIDNDRGTDFDYTSHDIYGKSIREKSSMILERYLSPSAQDLVFREGSLVGTPEKAAQYKNILKEHSTCYGRTTDAGKSNDICLTVISLLRQDGRILESLWPRTNGYKTMSDVQLRLQISKDLWTMYREDRCGDPAQTDLSYGTSSPCTRGDWIADPFEHA